MSDQQTIPPQSEPRGEPSSPLELPPRNLKEGLRGAIKKFKEDRGSLISAGMAFYWFLAVFPALLAAVGIIGLIRISPVAVDDISRAIRSTLPGDASRVLTDTLTAANSRPAGSSAVAAIIGIALALWSASAGMVALQTGLDVVYEVPEDRPFIKKRARALVLIVVSVVLGGIATAAIVFGQPIGEAIRDELPFGSAFILLWTLIRWAVGLAALVALFASFYYFGPNRETPRWTWLSPGGIVGTVIWLAASVGFSFYVSSFGNYAQTYGSFTGVVVLMLWLYLTAIAIVLGGEVNASLEMEGEEHRQQRRSRARRGRRGAEPPQAAPRPPSQPPSGDGGASAPNSYEQQWMESMRRLREDADRR